MIETTSPKVRVIVLEDDDMLRDDILLPGLIDFGFDVAGAGTAKAFYRQLVRRSFDIAVLDIGIPDESGLDVVEHIRGPVHRMGVVMLTADHHRENYLQALSNGADAFLSKPVDIDVLALTLRNLASRLAAPPALPASQAQQVWRLDSDGWCLVSPDGDVAALSASERSVMDALFARAGTTVEREELIAALTEDIIEFDPHRLEMLIYRVRNKAAKITRVGTRRLPLLSSRKAGYLIAQ